MFDSVMFDPVYDCLVVEIPSSLPSSSKGTFTRTIGAIQSDEGYWCQWSEVNRLAHHWHRSQRHWQAVYNILHDLRQEGLPRQWPEVFYSNVVHTLPAFWEVFENVDGFLVPR